MSPPIDPPVNPPTSTRWSRLDEALRRGAPDVARTLAPPAAPKDIAQLKATPWVPRSLIEGYAAHDGARKPGGVLSLLPAVKGAAWASACRWLPIAEVFEERDRLRRFHPNVSIHWCPIGRVGHFRSQSPYEAEDQYAVVINAATDNEAMFAVSYHEYGAQVSVVAPLSIGWTAYLDELTEKLESGLMEASADAYGVLRIAPLGGAAAAARKRQPARLDPGSALIAALSERGLLVMRGEPAPEILDKVRRALGKHRAAAQAAALVALFSEVDCVEEIFVDEKELAAFLEQF
jgi:cell wall assembly regulator SMI1